MDTTESHIPGTNMPVTVNATANTDVAAAMRSALFVARATAQRQAFEAERKLKGMCMSWAFDKLNLSDRI